MSNIASIQRRAKEAAKEFHDAIRYQRKAHWDDFLSDDVNIWKATKYLKAGKSTAGDKVQPLSKGDGSTTEDKADQADELLSAFFPPLPARIEDEGVRPQRKAVPMPGLTLGEIEEKVMTAKPWRAPRGYELPTAVWRQLWPVAKDRIFALFDATLRDGMVPRQWKNAKIVPLKEPHKDDYSVAKAWRPIPTNLAFVDAWQDTRSGRGRAHLICRRDLRSYTRESLRSEKATICRAGAVGATGTSLQGLAQPQGSQPDQF
ncbi:hypothetical protein HIM_10758 [Hirsutella minnesotensis 3608]|uniref:Reverse transcriptase n=1 Tax=Hirsutella minnesotensis 3608 TaxID=1043627 RepID=A0A0F7ZRM2_9HYPO|nr:hypothetical protein HIM_10758 [Hirsutella minnesotensis 3608]